MYTNWGIDPSLDYQHHQSSVLASLSPRDGKSPRRRLPGADQHGLLSRCAVLPCHSCAVASCELPAGYIGLLQLNTNQGGDGIGFGESAATTTTPSLTVTSEWYDDPSTLVTFPYRIQTNWAKQIPSNPGGDKHVIFIDPSSIRSSAAT